MDNLPTFIDEFIKNFMPHLRVGLNAFSTLEPAAFIGNSSTHQVAVMGLNRLDKQVRELSAEMGADFAVSVVEADGFTVISIETRAGRWMARTQVTGHAGDRTIGEPQFQKTEGSGPFAPYLTAGRGY